MCNTAQNKHQTTRDKGNSWKDVLIPSSAPMHVNSYGIKVNTESNSVSRVNRKLQDPRDKPDVPPLQPVRD